MVLVYVSLMVATIGEQVYSVNLWTIGSLLVGIISTLIVFNWDFIVRFWFTFPRDMRLVGRLSLFT